jgi:hypothetical protein
VERNIDPRQWDGGEAAFQFDMTLGLLLFCRSGVAFCDNFAQYLLDLLDCERLGELAKLSASARGSGEVQYLCDINLLDLEEVEHIRHGLKSDKFASANILLTLRCTE